MLRNFQWKLAQFAEIRWWKNYLGKKSVTDYLDYKTNYWNEFLRKINKEQIKMNKDQILDAGSGPAGIFIVINGNRVTAIDPLLDQYENKLDHFSRNMYPHVEFENKPIEEISFKSRFDQVFCLNCINHVNDIHLSMDRLIQAAKPGATIYLSIDAHHSKLLKWIFRAIPLDILHPHQRSLKEYQSLFLERGCSITQNITLKKGLIFDYILLIAEKPNQA